VNYPNIYKGDVYLKSVKEFRTHYLLLQWKNWNYNSSTCNVTCSLLMNAHYRCVYN